MWIAIVVLGLVILAAACFNETIRELVIVSILIVLVVLCVTVVLEPLIIEMGEYGPLGWIAGVVICLLGAGGCAWLYNQLFGTPEG